MIQYPLIYELSYKTYAVNEFGMASFFVIVGRDRGLVIDTGCGSFNSRELIEKLCTLPYDVLVSHAHGDHCGAMELWDEVWLHPGDLDIMENHRDRINEQLRENPAIYPMRGGPDGIMMPNGTLWACPGIASGAESVYDFKNIKFMGVHALPRFKFLSDGQIFDLGGRTVRVVHTPGHTAGSCSFIDSGSRILFSADSCNIMLGVAACSVNTTLKGLLALRSLRGEFDRNFNSHVGYGANLSCMSMPENVLDDCIWMCRTILAGEDRAQRRESALPNGKKVSMLRYGAAMLHYDPERLLDEGEIPVL